MASKLPESIKLKGVKGKITLKKLQQFSLDHYTYINTLLGDKTLRNVIEEEYPNPKWSLTTHKGSGEFADSFHHLCRSKKPKSKSKNPKCTFWCSATEGIQNMNIHAHDTLCQSYSILFYMGKITYQDTKLTKELQHKMVKTWSALLKNHTIKDQIFDSVQQKEGSTYLIPDIPETYRKSQTQLLKRIDTVLKKWKTFGYLWFMLNHKLSNTTSTECKDCDNGLLKF
jgi:hypothetical protein